MTRLKPFIMKLILGDVASDDILYSNVVFGESFGIHLPIFHPLSSEEKEYIEHLEKYRITIYYKNFKGIFNVSDWRFEEVSSYDPTIKITKDTVDMLKKRILGYLKKAIYIKKLKSALGKHLCPYSGRS